MMKYVCFGIRNELLELRIDGEWEWAALRLSPPPRVGCPIGSHVLACETWSHKKFLSGWADNDRQKRRLEVVRWGK